MGSCRWRTTGWSLVDNNDDSCTQENIDDFCNGREEIFRIAEMDRAECLHVANPES